MSENISGKKLLVIEDERHISDIITFNATAAGFLCDTAFDGASGLKKASAGEYDLIILDLMIPIIDGFEVCKRLRADMVTTPIIMVTAREEEADKVLGLELGADDYITKPFGIRELLARIKANIRRSAAEQVAAPKSSAVLRIGPLEIDNEKYRVLKNGVLIELSTKEYELLSFLVRNAGNIYTREELLEQVWDYEVLYGDGRTVDTTIRRLRQKIEDDPSKPKIIQTKRSFGYYIENNL